MVVYDARKLMKDYLEAKITATNLKKDDASTNAKFIAAYGKPDYALKNVFWSSMNDVDIVFSVREPDSTPLMACDQVPRGYEEKVPITISTVDKLGVTGTKIKWKAEAELRLVCETYPTGSQHSLDRRGDRTVHLGSTVIYQTDFVLNYRRGLT